MAVRCLPKRFAAALPDSPCPPFVFSLYAYSHRASNAANVLKYSTFYTKKCNYGDFLSQLAPKMLKTQ